MKKITNGNTAEIYEYDENKICKLFYSNYPNDYINHEFNNANIIWELGIRTPKAPSFAEILNKIININYI